MSITVEIVAKYTLIVSNAIITVLGFTCFIFSVIDVSKQQNATSDLDSRHAGIINLNISLLLLMTTCFAWCGAFRRHRCSLLTYTILVLCTGVAQAAASILLLTSMEGLVMKEKPKVTKSLNDKYKQYAHDDNIRETLDTMHNYYECCGAEKPVKIDNLYPHSCCKHLDNGKCMNPHKKGCIIVVARAAMGRLKAVLILLLCASFFEIIAGVAAILYRKNIEPGYF